MIANRGVQMPIEIRNVILGPVGAGTTWGQINMMVDVAGGNQNACDRAASKNTTSIVWLRGQIYLHHYDELS